MAPTSRRRATTKYKAHARDWDCGPFFFLSFFLYSYFAKLVLEGGLLIDPGRVSQNTLQSRRSPSAPLPGGDPGTPHTQGPRGSLAPSPKQEAPFIPSWEVVWLGGSTYAGRPLANPLFPSHTHTAGAHHTHALSCRLLNRGVDHRNSHEEKEELVELVNCKTKLTEI